MYFFSYKLTVKSIKNKKVMKYSCIKKQMKKYSRAEKKNHNFELGILDKNGVSLS